MAESSCITRLSGASAALGKNNRVRGSTSPTRTYGLRGKVCNVPVRLQKREKSARLACFSSMDLQADPLPLKQSIYDPSGSGKFALYSGITNYYGSTNRFGLQLWEVKDAIKKSGNFQGETAEDQKRICLAVAMQEGRLMDAHDDKKQGLAANHSIYNLSSDMLLNGGLSGGLDSLDTNLHHLSDATNCIINYLQGWAPYRSIPRNTSQPPAVSTINFIRGGRTAYSNGGEDWIVKIYRRAIATMVLEMEKNNDLMGDNQRIEIIIPYI